MEKSIHELKAEFVYFCVCEKKTLNSFEIIVIIFKAYKKCKSTIQKGFLKALLIKTYFQSKQTSKVNMCKSNETGI